MDFFWINRDQKSFEWFVKLLSQLEIEQSEQDGVMGHFLDMHMYITSALQRTDMKAVGLQLALDLLHEKVSIRGLIQCYYLEKWTLFRIQSNTSVCDFQYCLETNQKILREIMFCNFLSKTLLLRKYVKRRFNFLGIFVLRLKYRNCNFHNWKYFVKTTYSQSAY